MPAGTPDQDLSLFEEILVECTAFQLAGALSPQSIEEAIDAVTQSLLTDGSASSSEASTPHASAARTPATAAAIEAVMAEQQHAQQQGAVSSNTQPAQPGDDAPDSQASTRPAAADDNLASASAGQLIAEGAPVLKRSEGGGHGTRAMSPCRAGTMSCARVRAGTARVTEAIAMSAVWASQKIMEHSERWRCQIEPAHPVNISPELKVHSAPCVLYMRRA